LRAAAKKAANACRADDQKGAALFDCGYLPEEYTAGITGDLQV
jgi:hypothetical protein